MGVLKGQFLLISSIIIGVIIISTSSTISDIQSERFHQDPEAHYLNMVKKEASKVDRTSDIERENLQEMISMIPGYSTETEAWDLGSNNSYDCFNVTLESPDSRLEMRCIN